jgi:hypothetical protein
MSVDCEKLTTVINCNYNENSWSGREHCCSLLILKIVSKLSCQSLLELRDSFLCMSTCHLLICEYIAIYKSFTVTESVKRSFELCVCKHEAVVAWVARLISYFTSGGCNLNLGNFTSGGCDLNLGNNCKVY